MKTRYKAILGLAFAMLLFVTSCENMLYQEPRLRQTNELSLSTYDGLQKAVLGSYTPLYETSWYGENIIIYGDLKGGNAKLGPISTGRFRNTYQWVVTPSSAPLAWTIQFRLISRVNNIINVIEEGFEETGVDQSDLDILLGECKFLRALAYFDLAKMYCQPYAQGSGREQLGVPVVMESVIGQPARDNLGVVYDQIIDDLLAAEENLPEVSINEGNDPSGWATKYAAQALLARVYLYMEDWQTAADYATEVIDNFPGRLYTADECTTWDQGGVWGTDDGVEVIFEVYGSEGNSSHGNWEVISYLLSPNGYGDVVVSNDLYELYEDTDVRKNLFTNTSEYPNDHWVLKYPGKEPSGNLRQDNIVVLRLAEMYLIRAEAQLEGASVSGSSAVDDLNAIRSNRNASTLTSATLADVYTERRLELCFEGHQLWDLSRTGRSLERVDFDGTVNQNVPFPGYLWAYPIPQAEMDANENMEQNPGYSSTN